MLLAGQAINYPGGPQYAKQAGTKHKKAHKSKDPLSVPSLGRSWRDPSCPNRRSASPAPSRTGTAGSSATVNRWDRREPGLGACSATRRQTGEDPKPEHDLNPPQHAVSHGVPQIRRAFPTTAGTRGTCCSDSVGGLRHGWMAQRDWRLLHLRGVPWPGSLSGSDTAI